MMDKFKEQAAPILFVLLLGAAFYLGKLQTELSMIKDGGFAGGTADIGGEAGAPVFSVDTLVAYAEKANVKKKDFTKCYEDRYDEMNNRVTSSVSEGMSAGIGGTPGVILLDKETGMTAVVPGAVPYDMLKGYVDDLIAGVDTNAELRGQEGLEDLEDTEDLSKNVAPPAEDDNYYGNLGARYAMIEYSDFDCPYCGRFHPTAKQVADEYKDQLVWVYRHFPLDQIHPNARAKSVGAECVSAIAGNEAFWAYTDAAFGL